MNADAKHKLIRCYAVSDAAVHDSQELDGLLDEGNTCNDVFADSAYRSTEIEAHLRASGYKSRIHRRGRRNHPLSSAQQRANHAKSRIRARIEHVFGAQQSAPGGRIVRTIGMMRARAKIGLQNLAYNIRHQVTLEARRGMKWSRPQYSKRSSGRKEKGSREDDKSIENRTQPELVPNQASKSNIVRGSLMHINTGAPPAHSYANSAPESESQDGGR